MDLPTCSVLKWDGNRIPPLGRGDAGGASNPSLEGGSKLPGGSEMQGGSLEAGGGLEQQFVEEAIVYNDRWAEKRGTVSPPKSERRTYFVCRSDGTAAEFRPESIESFNRGASTVTRTQ